MSGEEKLKIRDFSAHLLKEWGFDFPPEDPVMPALYVFHKENEVLRKANEKLQKEVQDGNGKLSADIKKIVSSLQPVTYNFSTKGEAWKFKVAGVLPWLIGGMFFIITLWSVGHYLKIVVQEQNKTLIIKKLNVIDQQILPSLKIDNDGDLYLEASSMKDTIGINEFVLLNNGKVRVYLGRVLNKGE